MGYDQWQILDRAMRERSGGSAPAAAVSGWSQGLNNSLAGAKGLVQGMIEGGLGGSGDHCAKMEVFQNGVLFGVLPQKMTLTSTINVFAGKGGYKAASVVVERFDWSDILDCVEVDGTRERTMHEWRMAERGVLGAALDATTDRGYHALVLQTRRGDCNLRTSELGPRRAFWLLIGEGLGGASTEVMPPPPPPAQLVDRLGRLEAALRDGILTQAEFDAKKASLFGGEPNAG